MMESDLISRSELKKVLKRWAEIYRDDITVNAFVGLGVAAGELRKAPAIDAVPVVHARWIDLRESHKDIPKIECSNCKTVIIGLESNFCPKCGARMDSESEEEG